MLSFSLPCLLQGCQDAGRPAWAGSGASAEHGMGLTMHLAAGCRMLGAALGGGDAPVAGLGKGPCIAPGVMCFPLAGSPSILSSFHTRHGAMAC